MSRKHHRTASALGLAELVRRTMRHIRWLDWEFALSRRMARAKQPRGVTVEASCDPVACGGRCVFPGGMAVKASLGSRHEVRPRSKRPGPAQEMCSNTTAVSICRMRNRGCTQHGGREEAGWGQEAPCGVAIYAPVGSVHFRFSRVCVAVWAPYRAQAMHSKSDGAGKPAAAAHQGASFELMHVIPR
eukprot:scaffold712_cov15-Tisochrysis_lutea.AAC.1